MWRRHASSRPTRYDVPSSASRPPRPPVRGRSAAAVRRGVRGVRARPGGAGHARPGGARDRPAPQRRGSGAARAPGAEPTGRSRPAVPRDALVAAERRGALAFAGRLPDAARTRPRRPARGCRSGASGDDPSGLRERGTEFAGPVADDEVLYSRARCFVDVGVGGSGTKVKVLNSLARGLPVVTGRTAPRDSRSSRASTSSWPPTRAGCTPHSSGSCATTICGGG